MEDDTQTLTIIFEDIFAEPLHHVWFAPRATGTHTLPWDASARISTIRDFKIGYVLLLLSCTSPR